MKNGTEGAQRGHSGGAFCAIILRSSITSAVAVITPVPPL